MSFNSNHAISRSRTLRNWMLRCRFFLPWVLIPWIWSSLKRLVVWVCFLRCSLSMSLLQLKFVKVWSHKLLLLIIYIRENSLFDTPKTANSFLGPRKLNIPYLTLLQTFHSQYDIPSKSVSMHYISIQDYTSTSYIYTQGFQNILNFLFMIFL